MESLYLLLPLSAFLVLALLGVFAWALNAGQFEDLDHEGARILAEPDSTIDGDQTPAAVASEK
jgi:cbb3-type cytochrome oxidase maturation protein